MKGWSWKKGSMSCGSPKHMLSVHGHGEIVGIAKHEGKWALMSFCSILGWSAPSIFPGSPAGLKAAKKAGEGFLFLWGAS